MDWVIVVKEASRFFHKHRRAQYKSVPYRHRRKRGCKGSCTTNHVKCRLDASGDMRSDALEREKKKRYCSMAGGLSGWWMNLHNLLWFESGAHHSFASGRSVVIPSYTFMEIDDSLPSKLDDTILLSGYACIFL